MNYESESESLCGTRSMIVMKIEKTNGWTMNEFNAKAANPSRGAKSMKLNKYGSQYEWILDFIVEHSKTVCASLQQTIALIYKTYKARTHNKNQINSQLILLALFT